MKIYKLILTLIILSVTTVQAEIVPLENFFKDAQFRNVKISPDGAHIAFTYDDGDIGKLGVMELKTKKIKSTFDFGENTRIWNFYWANNERILMSVGRWVGNLDKKGGPQHLYGADINGKNRKQLFNTQNSSVSILSLNKSEPRFIYVGKRHFSDRGQVKLHRMNVNTGKLSYRSANAPKELSSILITEDGDIRVGVHAEYDEDKHDILEEFRVFYKRPNEDDWSELSVPATKKRTIFTPVALTPDLKYAYFRSNYETETLALYRYDLSTGKGEKIVEDKIADIGGVITAEDNSVLAVRSMPDYPTVKFLDKNHRESGLYAALMKSFPGSNINITSYTEGGKQALVRVDSDKNPGEFYLFDTSNMSAKYIASTMSWIKPKQMAPMEPIRIKARDGMVLNGYLTLPVGKDKNLPMIVNPHGGPHGPRDEWGYNPEVQFLANRGYAVLQINFRGSGGYGQAFEEAGYRKWGREMQDDVTDATLWAIKEGIADKNRICIYGGSYGGYATLMGVVREPDLYQCGLGYVGVYDLEEMYDSGDIPKRKSGVLYLEHVLGRDQAVLRANSPAFNVDKIKADLFIAHGSGDVRVPMPQFNNLINALERAGKPHKTMVKDEGHGYVQEENKFEFYSEMEKFFEKNIGK